MSDSRSFPPNDPASHRQDNPQSSPHGRAPALVKWTAIINIVMAALDILYALFFVLIAILIATGNTSPQETLILPERPAPATGPADPSDAAIAGIVLAMGLFPAAAGILKLIAGMKLLRGKPRAWGFGLSAGIVGCLQIWCMYFCALPMAIGIFTIIVMSLQSVRNYLRDRAALASASSAGAAGSII